MSRGCVPSCFPFASDRRMKSAPPPEAAFSSALPYEATRSAGAAPFGTWLQTSSEHVYSTTPGVVGNNIGAEKGYADQAQAASYNPERIAPHFTSAAPRPYSPGWQRTPEFSAPIYPTRARVKYHPDSDDDDSTYGSPEPLRSAAPHSQSFDNVSPSYPYSRVQSSSEELNFFTLWQQADRLKNDGQYEKAIMLYKASRQAVPHYLAEYNKIMGYLACSAGDAYLLQEKFSEVIGISDFGIRHSPTEPFLYSNKGEALQLQKRYKEALEEYQAAIVRDPSHFLPHIGIATIYQEEAKKLLDSAEKFLDEAFKISKDEHAISGLNVKEKEWVARVFEAKFAKLAAISSRLVEDPSLESSSAASSGSGISAPVDLIKIIKSYQLEAKKVLAKSEKAEMSALWEKMKSLEQEMQAKAKAQEAKDAEQDARISSAIQTSLEMFKQACKEIAQRPTRAELADALEDAADKAIYTEQIASNTKLNNYYLAFLRTFNQTFAACFVQGSGKFEIKTGALDLKGVIDLVPIPFAKEALGLILLGVNKGLEIHEINKIIKITSLASSISGMEAIVAKLALTITINKKAEIEATTDELKPTWYNSIMALVKKVKSAAYIDPNPTTEAQLAVSHATKLIADCMLGKFDGSKGLEDLLRQFTEYYTPSTAEGKSGTDISEKVSTGLDLLSKFTKKLSTVASAFGLDTVATISDYVSSSSDAVVTLMAQAAESEDRRPTSDGRFSSRVKPASKSLTKHSGNSAAQLDGGEDADDEAEVVRTHAEEGNAAAAPRTVSHIHVSMAPPMEASQQSTPFSALPASARVEGDRGAGVRAQPSQITAAEANIESADTAIHAARKELAEQEARHKQELAAAAAKIEALTQAIESRAPEAATLPRTVTKVGAEGSCCKPACVVMKSQIIYDNEVLNHPELLARAYEVNPDLYNSIIELGHEGHSIAELAGLVEIYSTAEI